MSFLNFSFNIMAYEDQSVNNPQIKSLDVSKGITGINISGERTDKFDISPGESVVAAATIRSLTQDNTTQYSINHDTPEYDQVRMSWTHTGTAPGFATKRNLSIDATTEITISRVNNTTAKVQSTGGTSMVTTAVQVGDIVKFEKSTSYFGSNFGITNQSMFKVIAKGSDYIDVIDNNTMSLDQDVVLGIDYDKQLRCFSAGPIKIGDILQVTSASLNQNNTGRFQVVDFAYDYVQYTNTYAVDEIFTNSSNVQVYDRLIGFLYIRTVKGISVKINDGNAIKVSPLGNQEGYFIGSVEAYKLELINDSLEDTSATVHQSSVY